MATTRLTALGLTFDETSDEDWIEFVLALGKDDEERSEALGILLACGYGENIPMHKWVTMMELYKLLKEQVASAKATVAIQEIYKEIARGTEQGLG